MTKPNAYKILYVLIHVFFISLILILMTISIYANIKYWNVPVSDIPGWAVKFIIGVR